MPKQSYVIFNVESYGENKNYWRPIGRGYINKDNSFSLFFDCIPVGKKWQLQMRATDEQKQEAKEKEEKQTAMDYEEDDVPF